MSLGVLLPKKFAKICRISVLGIFALLGSCGGYGLEDIGEDQAGGRRAKTKDLELSSCDAASLERHCPRPTDRFEFTQLNEISAQPDWVGHWMRLNVRPRQLSLIRNMNTGHTYECTLVYTEDHFFNCASGIKVGDQFQLNGFAFPGSDVPPSCGGLDGLFNIGLHTRGLIPAPSSGEGYCSYHCLLKTSCSQDGAD